MRSKTSHFTFKYAHITEIIPEPSDAIIIAKNIPTNPLNDENIDKNIATIKPPKYICPSPPRLKKPILKAIAIPKDAINNEDA